MPAADPAGIDFYRSLTEVSFTLLGLWFTVLRLAHGGWRDAARHQFTLRIALHFFLPGMIGMASQLSEGADDGGLFWRSASVLAGLIGLVVTLRARRPRDAGPPPPGWKLSRVDPVLYLAVVVVGVLPPGLTGFAPLQLEGAVTGVLFLVGLCIAWMAFAEAETAEPADSEEDDAPVPTPPAGNDVTVRVDLPVPGRTGCRFAYLCTRSPAQAPALRCAPCPATRR